MKRLTNQGRAKTMPSKEKYALFTALTVITAGVGQLLLDAGHKEVGDSLVNVSEHIANMIDDLYGP